MVRESTITKFWECKEFITIKLDIFKIYDQKYIKLFREF